MSPIVRRQIDFCQRQSDLCGIDIDPLWIGSVIIEDSSAVILVNIVWWHPQCRSITLGSYRMLPAPRLVIAARILLELSQSDLAAEARIGIATLRRYERGDTNPRADKLDAILRALGAHGIRFIEETDTISMGVMLMKKTGKRGRDVWN